jgi:short-subunit dehydrogenase
MKKVALVTGASSGIGLELARIHASRGGDLILVARRKDELDKLKAELQAQYNVEVLVIAKDLSLTNAAEELYQEVKSKNIDVEYLVNNAGYGGHGKFIDRDWEKDKAMINVNVMALVTLTRLFLPEMVARNSGRVLNVGSVGGFLPGPLQSVYYATKGFVLSFSQALANELQGTKVTITVLCPGATRTGFAQTANMEDVPGFHLIEADAPDVARFGYDAMLQGKTTAIHGFVNKFFTVILRFIPRVGIRRLSRMVVEKY